MAYRLCLAVAYIGTAWGFGDRLALGSDRKLQANESIGESLTRTFGALTNLPHDNDALNAAGWYRMNAICDPNYGYKWALGQEGPKKASPLTIHTSAARQLAGIGLRVFGAPEMEQELVDAGYWVSTGTSGEWDILVMFRGESLCDPNAVTESALGDRLIINPETISESIPITESDTKLEKYHMGSCFEQMGTHYFKDIEKPGQITWKAKNLMPVVPMYHEGKVHGIFFTTTTVQSSLLSSNWWEPIPLATPTLMCKNFCDDECTKELTPSKSGTHFFDTLHIFFKDPVNVQCPAEWTCDKWNPLPTEIQCCPNNRLSEPTSDTTTLYSSSRVVATLLAAAAMARM